MNRNPVYLFPSKLQYLSECLLFVGFFFTLVHATESTILTDIRINDVHMESRQYNYTMQPQKCGIPNIIPGQAGFRPDLIEGVWYSYRQTPPIPVNQYYATVGIKETHLPEFGIAAGSKWYQFPKYASDNKTCTYIFWSGYVTVDARWLGETSSDSDGYIPRPDNYISLYYEYSTFGIDYQCALPNYATGFCDEPLFFVNSRTAPSDLPADAMQRIDDVVASLLKPYCISLDSIPKTVFTKALPLCPFIDTPDCFTKRIQGYADSRL